MSYKSIKEFTKRPQTTMDFIRSPTAVTQNLSIIGMGPLSEAPSLTTLAIATVCKTAAFG